MYISLIDIFTVHGIKYSKSYQPKNSKFYPNYMRNIWQILLKIPKVCVTIIPKLFIISRKNVHRKKRRTFPFKILFVSSRYDFRFLRYRRVKTEVIFGRFLSLSLSHAALSLSRRVRRWPTAHRVTWGWSVTDRFPGKNVGHGVWPEFKMADRLARVSTRVHKLWSAISSERIEISTWNKARFKRHTFYYFLKIFRFLHCLSKAYFQFVFYKFTAYIR